MSSTIAITRAVSPTINQCELTHLQRDPIDFDRARTQHRAYEERLRALGCKVISLPTEEAYPDSVFVEDVALVLDEVAVMTRPGARSRQGEGAAVAAALTPYRDILHMQAPATLDGGDILRIDREIFVGVTSRSNDQGFSSLAELLRPFGYRVRAVEVRGCLHLKSAVTQAADDAVVLNPNWVDPTHFAAYQQIEVAGDEPSGANVVWLDGTCIAAAAFPRTNERLAEHDIALQTIDASELAKAEGALTCCSLLFST